MSIDRKAAIAAYKGRKVEAGIYAIRCLAAAGLWLGQAPDTATVQRRHWFALRMGSHGNRVMQAAWQTHGEASFGFEILELLPDEDDEVARSSQLRDALHRWRDDLHAAAV